MNKQKLLSVTLALLLCSVVMFSAFYVVAENNHDCSGENCPICFQINMCESTVKSIGTAVVAVACLAVTVFVLILNNLKDSDSYLLETPVSLKVKLTN